MTSLSSRGSAPPKDTDRPIVTTSGPALPDAWVRKGRDADRRLQGRMRVIVAVAVAVFVSWAGWQLLF